MKLNPNVLEVGTCRKDLWSPLGQAKETGGPALGPAMGFRRSVTKPGLGTFQAERDQNGISGADIGCEAGHLQRSRPKAGAMMDLWI